MRRAAVLALSTAAHNKPSLVKGLLPELLPLLYDQTVVKVTLTQIDGHLKVALKAPPFRVCLVLSQVETKLLEKNYWLSIVSYT